MQNLTSCKEGWAHLSEFMYLQGCDVDKSLDTGLRYFLIVLASIFLIAESLFFICKRKVVKIKNSMVKILLVSSFLINIPIIMRNIIGLTSNHRSINNIGVNLLTNITASFVADIAILYTLFQINVLHKGSMEKSGFIYKQRKVYLGSLAAIKFILYTVGAIIPHYTDKISVSRGFWFATAIMDLGDIPYLCIAGITIYKKINKMEKKSYKQVGCRILIMTLIAGTSGFFTFAVSVVLLILDGRYVIEWMFLELCKIMATIFCGAIFFILILKNKRVSNISTSKSNTGKVSKTKSANGTSTSSELGDKSENE